MFNKIISIYNDVRDNAGKTISLSEFLFNSNYQEQIERIRNTEEKAARSALKRQLPCATVSGVFSPTRCASNLKLYSGMICLDIDGQDNPDIEDYEELKWQLAVLPQIAYAGLSVSGHGLFLIVPLKYPSCHKSHFLQLEDDFKQMGIILDHSCSDVCRLRTISYDANPLVNENAIPYDKVKIIEKPYQPQFHANYGADDTINKVARCCEVIDRRHIDLTSTYDEWISIGFSLASLGESGRQFFHICSRQNSDYKSVECDKKFDNLSKSSGAIGIGTFFKKCKDAGIEVNLP